MPQDLENVAEPLMGSDSKCIQARGSRSSCSKGLEICSKRGGRGGTVTCSKISVSGLENFAQPVEPLFEVSYILDGRVLYD